MLRLGADVGERAVHRAHGRGASALDRASRSGRFPLHNADATG
jgi:hypothetical protein